MSVDGGERASDLDRRRDVLACHQRVEDLVVAQALVRDAGDGEAQHGQRAGQGLDPGVAEPQGRGPPAILGEGGLCDPRKGWTRKAARALAGTYRSINTPD